jgi:ElaB/YqjD/DUF883 family membrane-anchored ribosome-binding protein
MANPSQSSPFPTTETAEAAPALRDPPGGPRGSDATVERMVQGAHQAVDRVAEKAGPAVERLRSGMADAAQAVHARADELAALGDEWVETCRNSVRQHPLAAVALALVAGMAVSRLLASRD